MERVQVGSSNLASIGYDPSTETLEIEFLNGRVYEYYGVPETIYTDLMGASSLGIYFRDHIMNSFSYQIT
ncbi:KTSC domain-containing protein, partial [Pseudomonas aeruginosa]|uniref:KTSC domain-containing protein n=1 Tax=Pseudomonas aeruginosa TaxID=287 RepID=UPI00235A247F